MRKSLRIAVSLPLVAALLGLGAAPAQANGVVLPPNGNGIDNSGLHFEVCPNTMYMQLPITPTPELDDSPIEGLYHDFYWLVEVEGYDSFQAREADNNWQLLGRAGSQTYVAHLTNGSNGAQPGDVLDITLTASARDSFDNETVSSNPISLQVTVLDPDGFANGSGTKADPYIVTTAEELNLIRCHENKHFELGNSINLNNEPWLPIRGGFFDGGQTSPEIARLFLDGNGFSISNLFVENYVAEGAGLFGRIDTSIIKDLVLESPEVWGQHKVGSIAGSSRHSQYINVKVTGASVNTVHSQAGAFIGHSDYRSIFRNIEVDGQVTGSQFTYEFEYNYEDNWYSDNYALYSVGGFIGYEDGDGSTFENIKSNVNVSINDDYFVSEHTDSTSKAERVGGFIGEAGENIFIRNVESNSNITLEMYEIYNVGGFAGDSEESLFSELKISSTINARVDYAGNVGGITGNVDSTSFNEVLSSTEINVYVLDYVRRIGGAVADFEYAALTNSDITSDINVIAIDELGSGVEDIGGLVGYSDSGSIQNVRSSSTIDIQLADGSNNPDNIDIGDSVDHEIYSVGGIVGEHDDYSSYADIESNSDINVGAFSTVQSIGGGFGYLSDNYAVHFNHLVLKGTVEVPTNSEYIGGFVGETYGSMGIVNTLIAVNVSEHVDMEKVGPVLGGNSSSQEEYQSYIDRTFSPNTFWDSNVETMSNNFESIATAATSEDMSNTEWLTTNDFDSTRFWKVEGSYPTLRLTLGTPVVSFVKFGQANKKLTLVFSPVKLGKRTFKINLPSTYASKKIKLVVIRGGVKVKTVKAGTLDLLGDRTFKSKVKLKKADKIQVKIGKKIVARHLVR